MKKYISMDRARLRRLFSKIARLKIAVIGDLMLDRFIWGNVSRISPEAPVPVVLVRNESSMPGGAANVARNLTALGCTTGLAGVVGKDLYGAELVDQLVRNGIPLEGILETSEAVTTVKTRIIAHSQQVVRVDRESDISISAKVHKELAARIEKLIVTHDAVIIEDYGKGVITQQVVDLIVKTAAAKGVITAADPKKGRKISYNGITVATPNRSEAMFAAGLEYEESTPEDAAGRILLKKWGAKGIVITLGEKGMLLFEPGKKSFHIPTVAREVYDVSGAGDTVISALTAFICAGATMREAAVLANIAGGIVVGKLGTAVAHPQEIMDLCL